MPKKVSGCWNYFLSVIQLRNLFALFDNQSRYIGRIESHTASVVLKMKKKTVGLNLRKTLLCRSETSHSIYIVMLPSHYAVGINILAITVDRLIKLKVLPGSRASPGNSSHPRSGGPLRSRKDFPQS